MQLENDRNRLRAPDPGTQEVQGQAVDAEWDVLKQFQIGRRENIHPSADLQQRPVIGQQAAVLHHVDAARTEFAGHGVVADAQLQPDHFR